MDHWDPLSDLTNSPITPSGLRKRSRAAAVGDDENAGSFYIPRPPVRARGAMMQMLGLHFLVRGHRRPRPRRARRSWQMRAAAAGVLRRARPVPDGPGGRGRAANVDLN
ncbi:hypothetical protein GQ55_3G446300 [Panicum hallii var. hallii]|jgi:hypothetical protein|uniref:Uncharacterized protein n=2 Tax=Panicum hallii TaxID=206008 RepID=A0A2T7EIC3_9POAL|nr:hypothetical protein PAHAL_3G471700 [Panicum hallii]PUZ67565.1 hypothetical protein GQ55_3G446300 [Panicum hallii var. hallii]